jgi:hypothetical protein
MEGSDGWVGAVGKFWEKSFSPTENKYSLSLLGSVCTSFLGICGMLGEPSGDAKVTKGW